MFYTMYIFGWYEKKSYTFGLHFLLNICFIHIWFPFNVSYIFFVFVLHTHLICYFLQVVLVRTTSEMGGVAFYGSMESAIWNEKYHAPVIQLHALWNTNFNRVIWTFVQVVFFNVSFRHKQEKTKRLYFYSFIRRH